MKRIYFLIPNIEVTKKIVDELLLARIDDRHIHVLAKRGTAMDGLPEASHLQKTDFVPALWQGMFVGLLTGFISGVIAMFLSNASTMAGGLILATSLAGAFVGAWVSSMVGSSTGNRQIRKFNQSLENGEFLLMVDLPLQRVEEVEGIVCRNHPETKFEGTEPLIPSFP
jgi:uncharacterized membrane protein YeaQ/YmgE (transglycosylase-associated protein family)